MRPARLIDLSPIRRGNEEGFRLVNTETNTFYRYACLSHRWDDKIKAVHQTTTSNLTAYQSFINLRFLPTNFRDAIAIAKAMDIAYLWIDSLCIIQAGDDNADLKRELAKMRWIYQESHLTIAAVSSSDSAGGCFISDGSPDLCFQISDDASNEQFLVG